MTPSLLAVFSTLGITAEGEVADLEREDGFGLLAARFEAEAEAEVTVCFGLECSRREAELFALATAAGFRFCPSVESSWGLVEGGVRLFL